MSEKPIIFSMPMAEAILAGRKTQTTGLSLFSGIGGLDLAFEAAGGHVTAMCETDPFCRSVLRKHWPDVPIFGDVTRLRGEDVGAVDVIFGGFPCQPFSVAGNQKGRDDARYLWPEFSRLVSEIKPLWVVAENVPGILSIAGDTVCEDLERQGYEVGIWNFEAAAVGAPHRRARIFFVAHSRSDRCRSRSKQRKRNEETPCKRENHPAARPGESSVVIPNAGRRMREGGTVKRTFCGEHEGRALADAERSDSAFVADTDGSRKLQQDREFGELRGRAGDGCETSSDTDGEGLQGRQRGGLRECSCERPVGESGTHASSAESGGREPRRPEAEEQRGISGAFSGRGREPESRLGGVADGLPSRMDGYWKAEPDIPQIARGVPDRVQRLKALGNAVVPEQAKGIFDAIMQAEEYFLYLWKRIKKTRSSER